MPDHREIYQRQAAQYAQLVSREDYQGNIPRVLKQIRPFDALDVVEFGAGTGRLSCMLAPLVNSILVTDISPHMLDLAIARLKAAGHRNWRVVVADNRNLPVAKGVADLAIQGWSFGHFTSWNAATWRDEIEQSLAQMKRVLRVGGTAVILETLGTGSETPNPPTRELAAYYSLLEEDGFSSTWIRTDYQFKSLAEAVELTRFFFGDKLAEQVARRNWIVMSECTGIWWLTV
jgi:ubiquinone/menaquinone biosynthesis C-methylase UbiE